MRIMLNIKNQLLKDRLEELCNKYDYDVCYASNFADIMLVENVYPDLFLCEVKTKSYFDLYEELRNKNAFYVPKTIFITEDDVEENSFIYKTKTLLDNKFDLKSLFSFSSMISVTKYEQEIIADILKYFGISTLSQGYKYLDCILKLMYLFPDKYSKSLKGCYNVVGLKYNKTCNAIQKAVEQSIRYAYIKKCKGILEILNCYKTSSVTTKQLITYMFSKIKYRAVI